MSKRVRVEIIVNGLVQGVGYRYYTFRSAAVIGVAGFVSNLYTGEVKVVAEGERFELEELIEKLRIGPFGAHVKNLNIDWQEPTEEFSKFEIRQ